VDVDPAVDQLGRHQVRARAGVLVHELAGVGDQADVERLGDLLRRRDAEPVHQVPQDLGRARGVRHHVVDRAEAGVVMVVVDVEDVAVVALEHLRRRAVDVAAVQEDDRALAEVGGRLVHEPRKLDEAVLVGQRELVHGHEAQRVLAERAEDQRHRGERADRVAVGVLVRRADELVRLANLPHHLLARRRSPVHRRHSVPASRSSSSSMRKPRSIESS
jgi:hypothetical protein